MSKFVYVALVVVGLFACERTTVEVVDSTVVDSAKLEVTDAAPATETATDVGEQLMTPVDSGAVQVTVDAAADVVKKD